MDAYMIELNEKRIRREALLEASGAIVEMMREENDHAAIMALQRAHKKIFDLFFGK